MYHPHAQKWDKYLQPILAAVILKYGRSLLSAAKMATRKRQMFIFLSMIADETSMRRCDKIDLIKIVKTDMKSGMKRQERRCEEMKKERKKHNLCVERHANGIRASKIIEYRGSSYQEEFYQANSRINKHKGYRGHTVHEFSFQMGKMRSLDFNLITRTCRLISRVNE